MRAPARLPDWRPWLPALLALSCAAANAGYDEGAEAHKRGDYATTLRELRPGAAAGDVRSQRGLAWLYEWGQGVAKDPAQAMQWYLKAAAQGDMFSSYRIGLLHEMGTGVPKDMAKALDWYRKAAEGGFAEAQSQLGWLYLSGEGVKRDMAQGVEWTRKAAAQGDVNGELNMGWAYRDGLGITADPKVALQWYRKAADKGHAIAQRNLGYMLENGQGTSRDPAQAMTWYRKAAAQGDAEAQRALASARDSSPAPTREARSPQAQPTGSLSLLCQLRTGQSYVFVVDERAQQVAARDSTGQDWVVFKSGQVSRQRLGDQWVPVIDSVRVDAAAIRLLREPRDDPSAAPAPKVSNNRETNELVGLLGALVGTVATSSTVTIDRNTGIIRTGGMGLFPNNGSGVCEPWSGRRF